MLPIVSVISNLISNGLDQMGHSVQVADIHIEHPGDLSHGDYSTNVALKMARESGVSSVEFANSLVEKIKKSGLPIEIDDIAVAGPGFINIHLSDIFYGEIIGHSGSMPNKSLINKTIMIEYTDPNPFKEFHIGHLMTNAIGESLARIAEINGARVIRANYQGDVGPHVAKCVWGMKSLHSKMPHDSAPQSERSAFLGQAYAYGSAQYDESPEAKAEIMEINKMIYDRSDKEIVELYETGRSWSLSHFEDLYVTLGTKFDVYYFESEMAGPAVALVREHVSDIFVESDGAIVYPGEHDGLHTRVFVTSQGTPTYDAKDLVLGTKKFKDFPNIDQSIYITANEQNEYFKVMFAALRRIDPDAALRSQQLGHGMMLGSDGKKMSSRKGTALTGESLLHDVLDVVREKMVNTDRRDYDDATISAIAVGAIKYSILRQTIGKNIVFDFDTSLSMDGDSGPYLQYTHARLCSLLEKAQQQGYEHTTQVPMFWIFTPLEKILYRFPEIAARAWSERSPQLVASYVVQIAQEFNTWYGATKIIDESDSAMGYKLTLCESVRVVIAQCLNMLGIVPLQKM